MARGWPPSLRTRGTARPHIFVCGSPRSGTTFVARALGAQPGLVDLGEVKPLKAEIAKLAALPEHAAAPRLRRHPRPRARARVRAHLGSVEQTPETAFVLGAVLTAYPESRAVHALRDGRDVVCSLLERGWLRAGGTGQRRRAPALRRSLAFLGRARAPGGVRARERRPARGLGLAPVRDGRAPGRRAGVRPALRGARADHVATARRLAAFLDLDRRPRRPRCRGCTTGRSAAGDRELTGEQLADVEAEAGGLLRELGYA